jgi:hypothetical protein
MEGETNQQRFMLICRPKGAGARGNFEDNVAGLE